MKVKNLFTMLLSGFIFLLISAVFASAAPPKSLLPEKNACVVCDATGHSGSSVINFSDADYVKAWAMEDNPISNVIYLIGNSQLIGSVNFNHFTVIKQC